MRTTADTLHDEVKLNRHTSETPRKGYHSTLHYDLLETQLVSIVYCETKSLPVAAQN